ncbi:MAG: hypothetical protein ABID38_04700 [Candidatus Diapherotrites archaeon]
MDLMKSLKKIVNKLRRFFTVKKKKFKHGKKKRKVRVSKWYTSPNTPKWAGNIVTSYWDPSHLDDDILDELRKYPAGTKYKVITKGRSFKIVVKSRSKKHKKKRKHR